MQSVAQLTALGEIVSEMSANSKEITSLAVSVVGVVLLFGVTWYFQSSLSLLQQHVENDRKLLLKLQDEIKVSLYAYTYNSEIAWVFMIHANIPMHK